MGKGTIISGGTDGLYSVKLLYDRTKADKALAQIERWILMKEGQIAALPVGDPEHKLPGLKLSLASLNKQRDYLLSIPEDPTFSAWCADLTEDLSGEVATIEINGDTTENVLIRPGYLDNAAHMPLRDGQLQNIMAMTAEQAFYNLAMAPGWKKWMPTYRFGTLLSISGDTCSVSLDTATTPIVNAGAKSINEAQVLSNVDIGYMDCNGAAFTEGDRVVVQFYGQDFDAPKVIGFRQEPKECDRNLLLVWVSPFDEYSDYYQIGYNHYGDRLWRDKAYSGLNGHNYAQLNMPMAFFFWDISKDEYAGEEHKIYWINPNDADKNKNYLKATDYPFANPIPQTGTDADQNYFADILSTWKGRTNTITTPIYTISIDGDPHPTEELTFGESGTSDDGYYAASSSGTEANNYHLYSQTLHGSAVGNKATDSELASGILDVPDFSITGSTSKNIHFVKSGSVDDIYIETSTIENSLTNASINSLLNVSYNYEQVTTLTYTHVVIDGIGGLVLTDKRTIFTPGYYKIWGNEMLLSSSHAVQIHTYRGHESNTFCQCAERDPITGEWDITERSTKLESACKGLIALGISMKPDIIDPVYTEFRSIKITAAYYKGQTLQLGMLDELDERRESLPVMDLIDSTWCRQSAQALVDSWMANAELMHGDPADFGERVGGENIAILSIDKTIAEVVNGWMASPHHRELIMNTDMKYAGYASGIYPDTVTSITLGPGQYDPTTGSYTTENTTMEIPEAYRGKMKAYCLRMTQYLDEND